MTPNDPHDLQRFLDAQERVYGAALAELSHGRKPGHWMWFVFPQVSGLGFSPMATRFGIGSIAQARAYLAHPVLGGRLRECAAVIMRHGGRNAREMLGTPDDLKLRSCMTLFAAIDTPGSEFTGVLDRFYGGQADPLTLEVLERWRSGPVV